MAEIFVSYTSSDVDWAEWVAWTVEEEGHVAILQKWDFRPSGNFALDMQVATAKADRTIAILSPDYLKSTFAAPEWAAAFVSDPTGSKFKLLPVRVRDCEPKGLLKAVGYIDLVGVDETTSKQRLRDGLITTRAKPLAPPVFPGRRAPTAHPVPFPGKEKPGSALAASATYIPKIRRNFTDFDKRQFAKQGFREIQEYFTRALAELHRSHPDIDHDMTPASEADFSVDLFVDGESQSRCRIWMGAMFDANSIGYFEGQALSSGAMNESLSVTADEGELAFKATMGGAFGRLPEDMDLSHLSNTQAAEYLWRRFVARLEY